jgi:hypothetical protein
MGRPKKFNKSTSYILPMLGGHISEFMGKNGAVSQYRNTYIACEDRPDHTEHIFLLYEFSANTSYLMFEERMKLNPFYVDSYEPDYKHTMYIFSVPSEYKKEFESYKAGKYSKFSGDYIIHLMRFHSIGNNHPVVQTLTRAEERYQYWEKELNVKIDREAEVSSPPDMNLETYQESFKEPKKKESMKPSQEF